MNVVYASAMVALVLNKSFNFSKLIFLGMKENLIKDAKEKFMMFPHFIQHIINVQHPDIPKEGESMYGKRMPASQVEGMRKNADGKYKFDAVAAGEVNVFGFFAGDDEFVVDDEPVVEVGKRKKHPTIPFKMVDVEERRELKKNFVEKRKKKLIAEKDLEEAILQTKLAESAAEVSIPPSVPSHAPEVPTRDDLELARQTEEAIF